MSTWCLVSFSITEIGNGKRTIRISHVQTRKTNGSPCNASSASPSVLCCKIVPRDRTAAIERENESGDFALHQSTIYRIAISIGLLTLSTSVLAQTAGDRVDIERAALDYLEGFYEGSTDKIRRSVHPDAHKFGFYIKDGKYESEPMSFEEMLAYANGVKESGNYPDENAPKHVDILDVLDQTAVVKVYAWWGSDYMTLARYDGKWMIVQVLWQTLPES